MADQLGSELVANTDIFNTGYQTLGEELHRQISLKSITSEIARAVRTCESLPEPLAVWSPLDKSISHISAVLDNTDVTVVPESPDVNCSSDGEISKLTRCATVDSSNIGSMFPTKSFCTRYLDALSEKSPSRSPKTPPGSPPMSRNTSLMTPPVSSLCSLLAGPIATVAEADNLNRADSLTECSLPAEPIAEDFTKPDADKESEPDSESDNDEVMDTSDNTGEPKENTNNDKDMDTSNNEVNVFYPLLSPIRSFNDGPVIPGPIDTSAAPMPHDGPIPVQIVFSFDTTGSMSQCIDQVKNELRGIIQRLLADVPFLKIAVIAHGDYCDGVEFYTIKTCDFTNDVNTLHQFVTDVDGTGGGDWEECYEYVLHQVRGLSWVAGTRKSLVMIGDAIPHDVNYPLNTLKLDWRLQSDLLLNELGVHIYAVQCQKSNNAEATPFWEELATRTGGKHISMEQFSTVVDLMLAICYMETGAEFYHAYEKEVRFREGAGMNKDLAGMFATLGGGASATITPAAGPSPLALAGASTATDLLATIRKTGAAKTKPIISTKAKKPISKKRVHKGINGVPCNCKVCLAATVVPKPKSTKRIQKSKPAKKKKPREVLSQAQFVFKNLKWEPWQLAMVGSVTSNRAGKWEPCRQGCTGFRRTDLFKKVMGIASVYEIAVQPKKGCKKYVTYCTSTKGLLRNSNNWDAHFLPRSLLQSVVDNALRQDCQIYLRRAPVPILRRTVDINGKTHKLSTALQIKNLMCKTYDYAWQKRKTMAGLRKTRLVSKSGITISGH